MYLSLGQVLKSKTRNLMIRLLYACLQYHLTCSNHAPKIRQCRFVLQYAPNQKSKELDHNWSQQSLLSQGVIMSQARDVHCTRFSQKWSGMIGLAQPLADNWDNYPVHWCINLFLWGPQCLSNGYQWFKSLNLVHNILFFVLPDDESINLWQDCKNSLHLWNLLIG